MEATSRAMVQAQRLREGESRQTVFVADAATRVGYHVARWLLVQGRPVRAFTSEPESPEALALVEYGAELAVGRLDDHGGVMRAATGTGAAVLATSPAQAGPEAETVQLASAADAVNAARVTHVVQVSAAGADGPTGLPRSDALQQAEHYLTRLSVPRTVVAPVTPMETFLTPETMAQMAQGRLPGVVPPDQPMQLVALDDFAAVIEHVLRDPGRWDKRRVEVATEERTLPEVADAISRVAGVEVRYEHVPLSDVRERDGRAARELEALRDLPRQRVDVARLRATFPDVAWRGVERWAREQDWEPLREAQQERPRRTGSG